MDAFLCNLLSGTCFSRRLNRRFWEIPSNSWDSVILWNLCINHRRLQVSEFLCQCSFYRRAQKSLRSSGLLSGATLQMCVVPSVQNGHLTMKKNGTILFLFCSCKEFSRTNTRVRRVVKQMETHLSHIYCKRIIFESTLCCKSDSLQLSAQDVLGHTENLSTEPEVLKSLFETTGYKTKEVEQRPVLLVTTWSPVPSLVGLNKKQL